MITNTGKQIIAKYLIGQAPAYASYIAFGCGAVPLKATDTTPDYSNQTSLQFEMLRAPITSRGYVRENGVDQVVLTAPIPSEERYEITEVGVYSAGGNPSAAAADSKTIYSFTTNENWEFHDVNGDLAAAIYFEPNALDVETQNVIDVVKIVDGEDIPQDVFFANANNTVFENASRLRKNERSRFLNDALFLRGNLSNIVKDEETGRFSVEDISPTQKSNHIHIAGTNTNYSQNSPTDELRLAFSIVDKDGTSNSNPDIVRMIVEFASDDTLSDREYASMQIEYLNTADRFNTNRYYVAVSELQQLVKSAGFVWSSVRVAKIFVSTFNIVGGEEELSGDYYVALDAMRIENVTSSNPLYGLTGYSIVKNTDIIEDVEYAAPIIKNPNTSSLLEFRFGMDVS